MAELIELVAADGLDCHASFDKVEVMLTCRNRSDTSAGEGNLRRAGEHNGKVGVTCLFAFVEDVEKTVIVIPSTTIPQGITAMLGYDPEGTVEDNQTAMTEALGNVDTMQITYAARDSDFDGHDIHQGDYLAIFGKSLFATSRDINAVLRGLAEKVRELGREYITIFYGEDITEKQAAKAAGIHVNTVVEATNTGTNANTLVYTQYGVPAAVVSIPLGGMHSYNEYLSIDDGEAFTRLIQACIANPDLAEGFDMITEKGGLA